MAEGEQRVTPLELFFDLVLVYAITQVTELMSHDPTWRGVGRGLLVLAALWWAWTGYAWLTNILEPEEGVVRAGVFGAVTAMLVAAIAVPTTPAAGTVQESVRSRSAWAGSWVAMSTERRGLVSVGSGFMAQRTTIGSPVVMPPSIPPERFVSR